MKIGRTCYHSIWSVAKALLFYNFQNSICTHIRHIAFATLQIELYRVVDYYSKWSTKFHNDCMLENYFTFNTSFYYFYNFQNSIRAHVGPTAFATLQCELYRVADYWSTNFHSDCMLENYFTLNSSFNYFYNFQNSIMAHVGPTAFATLQSELYPVADYWSTNFHNDCMLGNYLISLLRRLLLIFIIFKIVLGPRLGPELLQHSKIYYNNK